MKRHLNFAIFFLLLFMFSWVFIFLPESDAQEVKNSCIECHSKLGGELKAPVTSWEKGIHSQVEVSCQDCHGGNPKSMSDSMSKEAGFKGKIKPKDVPSLCGACHSDIKRMRQYNIRTDQLAEYKTSQHGKLLFEKGDENVATCVSCHNSHEVRKKDDPLSSVYYANIPETCAQCHADENLMKNYDIPFDQYKEYKKSYHGQILLGKISGKNPALAPNCATCHGIHGAVPPGVTEVANVCGNCHTTIVKYFRQSPHFKSVKKMGIPRCVSCHGDHDVEMPGLDAYSGSEPGKCGSCHGTVSPQYKLATKIKSLIENTTDKFDRVSREVETIEHSGRNIEDINQDLLEAETKLIEIGPVTHSLNFEMIKKLSDKALEKIGAVKKKIEAIHNELKRRKNAFIIVSLIIFAIVALLLVKRRTLSKN